MEPIIHLDDDVEIKIGLEVSSVTKEVTGPQGSLAYQIGTRNTDTVLRLRDGETQVLAGLISDEERSSASHLPGIGRIPMLGHLFSNDNNSNTKTEIILLIIPARGAQHHAELPVPFQHGCRYGYECRCRTTACDHANAAEITRYTWQHWGGKCSRHASQSCANGTCARLPCIAIIR